MWSNLWFYKKKREIFNVPRIIEETNDFDDFFKVIIDESRWDLKKINEIIEDEKYNDNKSWIKEIVSDVMKICQKLYWTKTAFMNNYEWSISEFEAELLSPIIDEKIWEKIKNLKWNDEEIWSDIICIYDSYIWDIWYDFMQEKKENNNNIINSKFNLYNENWEEIFDKDIEYNIKNILNLKEDYYKNMTSLDILENNNYNDISNMLDYLLKELSNDRLICLASWENDDWINMDFRVFDISKDSRLKDATVKYMSNLLEWYTSFFRNNSWDDSEKILKEQFWNDIIDKINDSKLSIVNYDLDKNFSSYFKEILLDINEKYPALVWWFLDRLSRDKKFDVEKIKEDSIVEDGLNRFTNYWLFDASYFHNELWKLIKRIKDLGGTDQKIVDFLFDEFWLKKEKNQKLLNNIVKTIEEIDLNEKISFKSNK